MCGRYTGDIDESEVLRGIYDLTWKLYCLQYRWTLHVMSYE